MKYLMLRAAAPLLILATGFGAFWLMGSRQQETRDPGDQDRLPEVTTVALQPFSGHPAIEVDGIVTPLREIQVSSEVAGRIQFKADVCRAGNFVRQGTPLITIDPRDYELDVLRLRKQQEQAEAELQEADVDLSNTESLIGLAVRDRELQQNELDRLTRLSRSVSESELDRARRAVVLADNALQTLRNQQRSIDARRHRLEVAKELAAAALQRAELDLERTRIAAPVDGVIVLDTVEQGSYVQRGTALFAIEDTSRVEVQCNLEMGDLYWLWRQPSDSARSAADDPQTAYQVPPTPAQVRYQFAGRDDLQFSWEGLLTRFEGIGLDERTRMVPCRVVVERPREATFAGPPDRSQTAIRPPALVRGMFVTVRLSLRLDAEFVKIPDSAVQPGKRVWCVRQGRLEMLGPLPLIRWQPEHAGSEFAERYWITPALEAGLSASDRLVDRPPPGAVPGMPVSVRASETAPVRSQRAESGKTAASAGGSPRGSDGKESAP
jgi:multidrug efflux pump subunit AcrA (membrane-fusion protein)